MIRRGVDPVAEIDIVEPWRERIHLTAQVDQNGHSFSATTRPVPSP
jgi:hypothetical protein